MDYTLIDAGNGEKLERVGPYLLVRPAPGAVWKPSLPASEWAKADAHYHRSSKGGGTWRMRTKLPPSWKVAIEEQRFLLRPTPFGHIGLFAEQAANWKWIRERCALSESPPRVLNLFAYTGGSSLAAAQGGAKATHVDASRGIVTWARENAELNGLKTVRWIVDDVLKFVKREEKRGSKYEGLILDPPSFGRGADGEVWKIEDDLPPLLDALAALLSDSPHSFIVLTSHSPGFTAETFRNLVGDMTRARKGTIEAFELGITATTNRILPAGSCARWAVS